MLWACKIRGIDHVLAYELPQMKQYFHKPVMANVSGFSVEDYVEVCRRLDGEEQVGWLEVNISCPNVHGGGMSFGTDPASAAEVTRAVKAVTDKPVIVKLSPNVTDIAAIARACEDSRRRWHQPHQHGFGDAAGSGPEEAPPGQYHRGHVRPGHFPLGGADGIPGL